MNEIISRWLQSGLLPEAAVLTAVGLLSLLLTFFWIRKNSRKRKNESSESMPENLAGDSVTEELPVAEVRAAVSSLRILEDIVFCESDVIIS